MARRLVSLLVCATLLVACGAGEQSGPAEAVDATPDQGAASSDPGIPTEPDEGTAPAADPGTPAGDEDTGSSEQAGVVVRFEPGSGDYFDLGFPSDLHRRPDGSIDFLEWPKLPDVELARRWLEAAEEVVEGWGLNAGTFVWLSGPVDPSTLPAKPADTLWPEGGEAPSFFWMDVDPSSPERGRTFPLEISWREAEGAYTPPYRLFGIPYLGLPRRSQTRYAVVVTDSLRDAEGEPVGRSPALSALLAGETVPGRHTENVDPAPYVEAAEYLAERGLPSERIVGLVLLTTADITARLALGARFAERYQTPRVQHPGLSFLEEHEHYVALHGRHSAPVVQLGEPPYLKGGGELALAPNGDIDVQGTEWVRFALSIPRGPMPKDGWPLLIYVHGSGGYFRQFLDRGAPDEPDTGWGPARVAARHGIAVMGFDMPLHGDRADPPDRSGWHLYNIISNPRALADNIVGAVAEMNLRTKLMTELSIDPVVAGGRLDPGESQDGRIRFDPEALSMMGQSMGSQFGVPWSTFDPRTKVVFFSGSGATLIQIGAGSREPFDFQPLLKTMLGYGADEQLDRFDPVLNILEHYWDIVDPVAHARHVVDEPHEGVGPKHVYQSSGLEDRYFDGIARGALTVSLGLDVLAPVRHDYLKEVMPHAGLAEVAAPLKSNRKNAMITALAVELEPLSAGRGHYVSFDRPAARRHWACFLRSQWQDGVPTAHAIEDTLDGCP